MEEEGEGGGGGEMRVYRVGKGAGPGGVVGEKVVVKSGGLVEVRVLRGREFYEGRAGCRFALFAASSVFCWGEWCGEEDWGGGVGEVVDEGLVLMNMIQSRRWTSSRTQ